MPIFSSPTHEAQTTAAGDAGKMIDTAELISGKSAFLQCEVEVEAGTAGADTIYIGYLPSGMTVIPGLSTITTTAVAGAGTFDIGVKNSPTVIAEAVTANAVGSALINSDKPSYFSASRQELTLTLDAALTSGGTFFVNLYLVNSN